jgi:DNA mismatch repair protein MSH6
MRRAEKKVLIFHLIISGDEAYDPATLFIPQSAYIKFTPFEKQFWDIKKKNFDTVIFFKKGSPKQLIQPF